jgi:iron complex transport system ATP-binding protein
MVTHHVDEIPQGTTHVLLLRDGRSLQSGTIGETLDAAGLSECFGVDLVLDPRVDGRFSAWARS